MQTQRPGDPNHSRERRVAVLGKGLVETLPAQPRLAGEPAHVPCPRDVVQRRSDQAALNSGNAATGRLRVVQDHRYKLVDGFSEEKELYEVEADPWEDENIAAARPDVVARLEKLLV